MGKRKKESERVKKEREREEDTRDTKRKYKEREEWKKQEGAALTSRDSGAETDFPLWMFERDFIKRARYTMER